MAAAADHQMIVNRDAQGFGGVGDLARHFDVGAAGGGIAAGVIMQQQTRIVFP